MAGAIIIGGDVQPDTGGTIVIGTTGVGVGASLIEFEIPRLPIGTVLLALVVRNQEVVAPAGWTKVIDGVGASSLFLDGWARMLEASDMRGATEALSTADFLSVDIQELQGRMLVLDNTAPSYMIEQIAHAAFAADATPGTPSLLSQQAVNRIVVLYSAAGAVDLGAPAGFAIDDTYSSSTVTPRTFLIASKIGNASGTIAPADGSSAPASTGRAWSIVLRNSPPLIPGELADVVPGHIGLVGPR